MHCYSHKLLFGGGVFVCVHCSKSRLLPTKQTKRRRTEHQNLHNGLSTLPNSRSQSCGQAAGQTETGPVFVFHRSPGQVKTLRVVCKKREKGDRDFCSYHVTLITPPPQNLGIHCLPLNTQCGETVTVKGEPYIVSGVTYRYQLKRGKYEPRQTRLDVLSTGRYLVNLYLQNLLDQS